MIHLRGFPDKQGIKLGNSAVIILFNNFRRYPVS